MERTNRMSKLDDLSNAMADAGVYDNAESPDTDAAAVPSAEDATGHSPLPWIWNNRNRLIISEDLAIVDVDCDADDSTSAANGRHIVTCVNERDRLVMANRALVDALSRAKQYIACAHFPTCPCGLCTRATEDVQVADDALAFAKGGAQ